MEQNFTITEPFQLELLAHQLVEISARLQAAALKIAEQMGTPTVDELHRTVQRVAKRDDAVPGSLSVTAGPADTQAAMA